MWLRDTAARKMNRGQKEIDGGGGQYSNPFTFRFRSRGSPRIHVLLGYFFPPFNYYRKSCGNPAFNYICLFNHVLKLFLWLLLFNSKRLNLQARFKACTHPAFVANRTARRPERQNVSSFLHTLQKERFSFTFFKRFLTRKEIVLGKIFLV